MSETIGTRLKDLRQQKGFTLDYVGNIVGVSKQTLYKYEKGIVSNVPSDKIEALSALYGVSPAYLMGWNEKEEATFDVSRNVTKPSYYHDEETAALAQAAHDNPDLKILFDASRKLSPKDLKTVTNLVKSLTDEDD